MVKEAFEPVLKKSLIDFLHRNSLVDVVTAYLFFIQEKFNIQPVLFTKEKRIYQSANEVMGKLEAEGKIWREAEIKIGYHPPSVDDQTRKIYICPFTGKVFGDNTHPNPQDAIYDWVSTCSENKERIGGLRVKRFFVSEDPEVIQSYAAKNKPKQPLTKTVYSSSLSGKLFNSKEGVKQDFRKNYLNNLSLSEVQNQNTYEIEDHFLAFIKKQLTEDRVNAFVEALTQYEEFAPYVEQWLEENDG